MPDSKYCYPNSDVLINKLNIKDANLLFEAEKELTAIRLHELQEKPILGEFDFEHLKEIHHHIFQDLYDWAGKVRTVEIGKNNLFCTTSCIQDYASSVFRKYFSQCYSNKDNKEDFIKVFADNYGDLNALHPFREGNGRAQREFARLVCRECGYEFDLSCTTHEKMLEASKLSFDKADSSLFIKIFSEAVSPYNPTKERNADTLTILTSDDLIIGTTSEYAYYEYDEHESSKIYDEIYKAKITKMDAEKAIIDAKNSLKSKENLKKTSFFDKPISERFSEAHKKAEEHNKSAKRLQPIQKNQNIDLS